MTFVNEITKNPETGLSAGKTIDKEREFILTETGAHPESGHEFEIQIKNELIKFTGLLENQVLGSPKLGEKRLYEMKWKFYELYKSKNIKMKHQELLEVISEAIKAWGWNYNTDKAYSVEVRFTKNILDLK